MSKLVALTAVCGIAVCLFAFYVEHEASANTDFKAPCDVREGMSCSKVLTSKWGRGYGLVGPILGEDSPLNLPNSIYGLAFYGSLLIKESLFPTSRIIHLAAFSATVVSIFVCLYLGMNDMPITTSGHSTVNLMAYILAFVLKDVCIVCMSIYAINIILVFLLWPTRGIDSTIAKKNNGKKKSN